MRLICKRYVCSEKREIRNIDEGSPIGLFFRNTNALPDAQTIPHEPREHSSVSRRTLLSGDVDRPHLLMMMMFVLDADVGVVAS